MSSRKKKDEWDQDSMQGFLREQITGFKIKDVQLVDSLDAAASDVGLYLPHLALRYLFQRNVFPLERVTIFFGPTGSNKSSLLYYFYRLFGVYNHGLYQHCEVENKDTPEFRLSMLDWDNSLGKGYTCESMDDFQRLIKVLVSKITAVLTSAGGPGRRVPYVVGIDSLTAKMTTEAQNAMDRSAGVAGRRFADEARSLSDWFKYVPALLQDLPISLIAINHDKPVPGKMPGQIEHRSPGGAAPTYYATYRILVTKRGKIERRPDGYKGNRIKLTLDKNSLGTDKYYIDAEILWGDRGVQRADGTTVYVQHSYWNWDKATAELIARLVEDRDDRSPHTELLRETLGFSRSGSKYSCRALGIKSSDPVRAEEFGRRLEEATDVLALIEPLIGIRKATIFDYTQDFLEQTKKARANSASQYPTSEEFRAALAAPPSGTADDEEDEGEVVEDEPEGEE